MSAEALLGQNVALIYDFIRQAVDHRKAGEHWESLKMLDTAASLIYLDEAKQTPLIDLAEEINRIKVEALEIVTSSPEGTEEARLQHLDREAAQTFSTHLKALRNYMQAVGYYKMMNKSWDNRIVEMQEVDPLKARPTRRVIPAELSNDVISEK